MVAAQAAGRDLEAVETGNRAVQETMRAWNQERPCGTRCGEPSWTMARSQQSRNENTAFPPMYFDSIGLPRLLTVT
jgi:hypothetical protein